MTEKLPDGYARNSRGHLVPIDLISEIDRSRDDLVREIVDKAQQLRESMRIFKRQAFDDMTAFAALSAEKYGVKLGGTKGNLTLTSFDGRYQVKLSHADIKTFDERLHAAKEMVDACIHRWTAGSRAEIKALVEHAFQTDKEGKISVSRIYTLLQLDIDDSEWQQAMQALRESMQVISTSTYIRIYQRNEHGQYDQLSLDIAKV